MPKRLTSIFRNRSARVRPRPKKSYKSLVLASHSQLLALEPRLVFDAAAAATVEAVAEYVEIPVEAAPPPDAVDSAQNSASEAEPLSPAETANLLGSFAALGDVEAFGSGVLSDERDGPTIKLPDALTVDENGSILISGVDEIKIGEPDGPNEIELTISVEHGKLSFSNASSGGAEITNNLSWNDSSRTFVIKGDPTSVNEVLMGLRYTPDQYYSGTDTLHIDITYSLYNEPADPFSGSTSGHVASSSLDISIIDINNPAKVEVDRGQTITIAEDEWGKVSGISITDPDRTYENGDEITLELSVGRGHLGYKDTGGDYVKYTDNTAIQNAATGTDTIVSYDGATYTFIGSRDDINAILDALYYQGEQDSYGTDVLNVTARDQYYNEAVDGPKSSATVEIRVTPVPDAPTIDFGKYKDEDDFLKAAANENDAAGVVLTAEMFRIEDVDTGSPLRLIQLVDLPAHGALYRADGTAIGVGERFSVQDLLDGKIRYVHSDDTDQVRGDVVGNSRFYASDSFSFIVTDGTGNYVTGGEDYGYETIRVTEDSHQYDASKIIFVINLKSVNDPIEIKPGGDKSRVEVTPSGDPEVEDTKTLAVYEGEDRAIVQFGIVDPDQAPGVGHDIYITKLPTDGKLYWNGVEITELTVDLGNGVNGFQITQSGLDSGLLTYTHSGIDGFGADGSPAPGSGSTRDDSFGVVIVDDGGGTGVPRQYDQTDLDIIVYPNNDNPEFDPSVPVDQNNVVGNGISIDDNDDDDVDSRWWMNTFKVSDGFNVTDPDSSPSSITYTLTGTPSSIAIYYTSGDGKYRQLGTGDSFTQQDILDGKVVYRYTGGHGEKIDEEHEDYGDYERRWDEEAQVWRYCHHHEWETSLSFTVTDGSLTAWARDDNEHVHEEGVVGGIGSWTGGGDNGKQNWTLDDFTVNISVDFHSWEGGRSVDPIEAYDFNVGVKNGDDLAGYEGGTATLTVSNISAYTTYRVGSETVNEDNDGIVYRLMEVPANGTLCKNGVAMVQFESFTQADLEAGLITYQHGGEEVFTDSFEVTVSDGSNIYRDPGHTAATHPEGSRITIGVNLSPVNDRPEAGGEINMNEGVEDGQEHKTDFSDGGRIIGLHEIYTDADGGGAVEDGYDLIGGDNESYAKTNANVKVVVTELPDNGKLYVKRNDVWVEVEAVSLADAQDIDKWSGFSDTQVLTAADFANDCVKYVHSGIDADGFEDAFKIVVNDGKGVPIAGESLEARQEEDVYNDDAEYVKTVVKEGKSGAHASSLSEEGAVKIVIKPVNDYPIRQTGQDFHTPEGGNRNPAGSTNYLDDGVGTVIGTGHLQYTDSDNSAGQLQYVITTPPSEGTLYKKDSPGGAWYALQNSTFTQADIDSGYIKYVHNGTETTADSFTYTIRDPDGAVIANQVFNIIVDQTNDAPKVTLNTNNLGHDGVYLSDVTGKELFKDGQGAFQITDIDTSNANYDANALITVTISAVITETGHADNGNNWGSFTYSAANPANGGSVTSGQGELVITGTMQEVQAILNSLKYVPEGTGRATDINAEVTISMTVNDLANGDMGKDNAYALSAGASLKLYVSTYNDNPYFEGSTPDDNLATNAYGPLFKVTMDEDAKRVEIKNPLNSNFLQLIDSDAFGRNVNTLKLSVASGTLGLTQVQGLSILGNNSGEVTLVGTREQLNAALKSLSYTPPAEWSGAASIDIIYNDGNSAINGDNGAIGEWGTGSDGQKGFTASVELLVLPVNDVPTLEVPGEIIVIKGGGVNNPVEAGGKFITVDDANDLKWADGSTDNWHLDGGDTPDGPWKDDIIKVTVTAANKNNGLGNGTLHFNDGVSGLVSVETSGNGSDQIILTGTRAAVNAALASLTYKAAGSNQDQVIDLKIVVNDLGNGAVDPATGQRDASKAEEVAQNITLVISDVNDPPEIAINITNQEIALDEDGNHQFGQGDITVYDADALELDMVLTLSVEHGTLLVNRSGIGIYPSQIVYSNDGRTVTVTAGQTVLNQILGTLKYTPDANFNGADTLTVTIDDQGNNCADPVSDPNDPKGPNIVDKAIAITVTPVNDAPLVLNPGQPVFMTPIPEDAGASSANPGQLVSSLFGDYFEDTNDLNQAFPDDAMAGIVVVRNDAVDPNKGAWWYSIDGGSTWTEVGSRSESDGLYLDNDAMLRFVPAGNFNGEAPSLSVKLVENLVNRDGNSDMSATASMPTSGAGNINSTYEKTGIYSQDALTLKVTVTPVNDAPVVTGSTATLPAVNEDVTSAANSGQTVQGLFGSKFSDTNDLNQAQPADNFAGVMIHTNDTGNEATQGKWQYSLNGTDWLDVGTVSDADALYLASGAKLRFQPAADWHGTPPDLGVYLVETVNKDSAGGTDTPAQPFTSGTRTHDMSDVNRGGVTSVSAGSVTLSTSVTPVNDAPVLTAPPEGIKLDPIDEDNKTSAGNKIEDLFAGLVSDGKDADVAGGNGGDDFIGIVVIANTADPASEGSWKYSTDNGTSWHLIPSGLSDSSAFFLTGGARLCFEPVDDYNGTPPSLTVRAVESDANGDSGMTPPSACDLISGITFGGSSIFSAASTSIGITVRAVNDAPTVVNPKDDTDPTADVWLDNISATGNEQKGQKVEDLFADRMADPKDASPPSSHVSQDEFAGVVITGNAADPANGKWQYSSDGGQTWNDIPTTSSGLSESNGLYLPKDAQIRFQPARTDYQGEPGALTVVLVETRDNDNPTAFFPADYADDVNVATRGGTTIYTQDMLQVLIAVSEPNKAPVPTAPQVEHTTNEDATSTAKSVSELFGPVFSDPDAASKPWLTPHDVLAGVVVVSNTADPATQGKWQYSTDNGSNWQDVGSRGYGNGLYLNTGAALRFVPAADYNGTPPALEVLLAETVNGDSLPGAELPANATEVDVSGSNRGGATQYSDATVDLVITVNPVNDAPVINDKDTPVSLTAIDEDNNNSDGDLVKSLFNDRLNDAKDAKGAQGADSLAGIVIVGNGAAAATEGTWQYWDATLNSGAGDWVDVPTGLDDATGLYLAADAATRIRFVPVADYNGSPPSLTVRLVETDQNPDPDSTSTPPTATGETVDVSVNGGATIFSADTVQVGVSVRPVNDAPQVSGSPTVALDPVYSFPGPLSDQTSGGKSVEDLFGGKYSDPLDAEAPSASGGDAFAGVVVIGNAVDPLTEGEWQYSIDNGVTWQAVGNPGPADGLYLDKDAQLRFNPVYDYAGDPGGLTVLLAESDANADASGSLPASGRPVDASNPGGSSLFSSGKISLGITVQAPNHAPVPSAPQVELETNEDTASAAKTVSDLFGPVFSDTDAAGKPWLTPQDELAGVVVVSNAADPDTQGVWQYSADNGSTWQDVGSRGYGNGLYLNTGAALRFVPAADYNGTPPALEALLAETVNGDSLPGAELPANATSVDVSGAKRGGVTLYSRDTVKLAITVKPVNDAPVINNQDTPIGLTAIDEDDNDSAGDLVKDLFSGRFNDVKDAKGAHGADALAGIVVVGNSADAATEGVWQYWDASSNNWVSISTGLSDSGGLYLAADAKTALRFVPVDNYNGTPPSLTVRLVETDQNPNPDSSLIPPAATGQTVNVALNGGATIYSAETVRVGISVRPVNDAPQVSGSPSAALEPVISFPGEASGGKSVDDLFGGKYSDQADAAAPSSSGGDSFAGVAVIGNAADPASQGRWEYSLDGGNTWQAVGNPGPADALYLGKEAQLRFNPVDGYAGDPGGLTVLLAETDANADAAGSLPASGRPVDASGRGGASLFSSAEISLGIEVRAPNHAPRVSDTSDVALPAIDEDVPDGGASVGDLFGARFDDRDDDGKAWVDKDDFAGVVVLGNGADPDAHGVYQYSTDNGATWQDIGLCGDSNGLFLDVDAKIRFNPAPDYNGQPPKLSVILAETVNRDSLPGVCLPACGERVDTSGAGRGGLTCYGDQVIQLGVTVRPVDDAPRPQDDHYQITITQEKKGEAEGNLKLNDTHPDGVAFAVDPSQTAQGQYGRLSILPDGTFSYVIDPAAPGLANLTGPTTLYDEITYTVVDERGATATAKVVVEIAYRPNDEYVPVDDKPGDFLHLEDEAKPADANAGLKDLEVDKPVVNSVAEASETTRSDARDSINGLLAGSLERFTAGDERVRLAATPDAATFVIDQDNLFSLPSNLFYAGARTAALTYSCSRADGTSLPDWLVFDPVSMSFAGTPPADAGDSLYLVITARDGRGGEARAHITLKLSQPGQEALEPLTEDQFETETTEPAEPVETGGVSDQLGGHGMAGLMREARRFLVNIQLI